MPPGCDTDPLAGEGWLAGHAERAATQTAAATARTAFTPMRRTTARSGFRGRWCNEMERTHSPPFSIYSALGGLRQDPGRAVESPAEANGGERPQIGADDGEPL